ncbi:hypothetical protein ACQEWB_20910 [Streptomyces sp. CA-249302]
MGGATTALRPDAEIHDFQLTHILPPLATVTSADEVTAAVRRLPS